MLHKVMISLTVLLSLPTFIHSQEQHIDTFTAQGREYQVLFLEYSDSEQIHPWPTDLIMRWRSSASDEWNVSARIKGVRLERKIELQNKNGTGSEALVIARPGASAQLISVVEVIRSPPGFNILLDNELDKGSVDYWFDHKGRLNKTQIQLLCLACGSGRLPGYGACIHSP